MSSTDSIKLEIPRAIIADIIMERLNRIGVPTEITQPVHTSAPADLPAIGAAYQGGLYAGLTLVDNVPHALVLLPGDCEAGWKFAAEWAQQNGGELPSRFDGLVLFKNLKSEFKEEAHWLNERHASASGSAWYQHFNNGYQFTYHTDSTLRARAVRRFPLNNSVI